MQKPVGGSSRASLQHHSIVASCCFSVECYEACKCRDPGSTAEEAATSAWRVFACSSLSACTDACIKTHDHKRALAGIQDESHRHCGGVKGLLSGLRVRPCCIVAISLHCQAYYSCW